MKLRLGVRRDGLQRPSVQQVRHERVSEPECIWDLKAELGEGPIWSEAEAALYFVDILGRRVHRLVPGTGERSSWPAPARPTFIVPVEGGGYPCGLEDGLRRFDPADGRFGPLHRIEPMLDRNRLNDGCVDAAGRLWFGTMHDPEQEATGSLYRLTGLGPDPVPEPMDGGDTVSNGPAIDPVRGGLYHNDTATGCIYVFDLTPAGTVANRRIFARLEQDHPDGLALDAEGILWVALFAGGAIRRFRPDGTPDGEVALGCRRVTKIAFGDHDRRTACVTTSRKGLAADMLERQPLGRGAVPLPGRGAGHAAEPVPRRQLTAAAGPVRSAGIDSARQPLGVA